MRFQLDNSDVVMMLAVALLVALVLALRAPRITVRGMLGRAVLANLTAAVAVLGIQLLPALLPS